MTVNNNKVSLILSLTVSVLIAIILVGFSINITTILALSILLFGALYVLFRVILHNLIFKNLEQIWNDVRLLRKGKSPHDLFDQTFDAKWIDDEVKLLLKEKATEIGKLKEVEQFRKDFLGSVAHELRTPVFGIQGYLHTLIDGAAEDEKIRDRFIAKAAKNADSLTAIIEDLIAISRIETNEVKIEKSSFNLIELVNDVFEALEYQASQRQIQFITKGLEKVEVEADYQKIKQVFTNLLSNAIKYGKDNGICSVSTFDLRDHVLIEVADNGVGISKEDLPRVFERFYRADKSRSREKGSSTGLGLSIVKHFLDAHEREIKVRSSLSNGTIFTFTLAKSKQQEKQLTIKA